MAGKNPHEAVDNFLHPIQSVIACFADAVLDHKGGYDLGRQHVVLLPEDSPVPLRGEADVEFYFSQRYEVIRSDDRERGPWKIKTLGYRYRLSRHSDHAELISYHWHPDGKWKFPHLHVHAATKIFEAQFRSAHFPTQRTAVEDVLELSVNAFDAKPLANRETDWAQILRRTRDRFLFYKTW